jgi:hypothetical protein
MAAFAASVDVIPTAGVVGAHEVMKFVSGCSNHFSS